MKDIDRKMVSIIMATYNREHYILESLYSVLNQVYSDWECLIIDDGGTDDTFKIIEPLLRKDQRFKFYTRRGEYLKGLPGCRNMGLDMAKGNYIVFFDDDDIAHPDLLLIAMNQLKTSKLDYCRYLRSTFKDDFNENFDRSSNFNTALIENSIEAMITGDLPFNSCQVLWKRNCFNNNRFNETLMYAEEWECYSRILVDGAKGINVEKVLYYGRKHPNSNTGEFWNEDPIRMRSNIRAIELVIDNLKRHNLLSYKLEKYFLRLGFLFKKKKIIDFTLNKSNAGFIKKIKYKLGFLFYPVIKPILNFKSKLITD